MTAASLVIAKGSRGLRRNLRTGGRRPIAPSDCPLDMRRILEIANKCDAHSKNSVRSHLQKGQNRRMVGAIGFEPTTPCSRSRCATRLRYAPNLGDFCQRITRRESASARGLSRLRLDKSNRKSDYHGVQCTVIDQSLTLLCWLGHRSRR
jgi:hypothetical protein